MRVGSSQRRGRKQVVMFGACATCCSSRMLIVFSLLTSASLILTCLSAVSASNVTTKPRLATFLDQLLTSSNNAKNTNIETDFQLYASNELEHNSSKPEIEKSQQMSCLSGLLTFELSTGFIYKPASAETLAMMPSTLQLTDCLGYCLHNSSCLAINFEMGLCVLLSSSAKQNPSNLYSSQFPVFTIYAEKKCLLSGE